jgi:preprotein translocase subunit SecG
MGFLIGLLTLVLLLDCVVLVLLVLVQLPKKEAGAGLAFGGAASDALFGAGSGNVLTKITKYAAIGFFVLAVGLSLLQSTYHRRTTSSFQQKLEQSGRSPGAAMPTGSGPGAPASKPGIPLTGNTNTELASPPVESTAPAATAPSPAPTNTPPPK